jgi:hypothetical protein
VLIETNQLPDGRHVDYFREWPAQEQSVNRDRKNQVPYTGWWDLPNKILCLAPYISTGNAKQGRSYENGPNYLLAKPCNIHTLLDDLAIVYAKLLPSGASVYRIAGPTFNCGRKLLSNCLMSRSLAVSMSMENRNHLLSSLRIPNAVLLSFENPRFSV